MKIPKTVSIGSIAILLCINAFLLTNYFFLDKEDAFIDINHIYDEFMLTKELRVITDNNDKKRDLELSQMQQELQEIYYQIKDEKDAEHIKLYGLKRDAYLKREDDLKKEADMELDQYNERIWNQLNLYIKEYGKKKKLKLLFGTSGNGNLMYADERFDITKEVLDYVNQRYNDEI